MRTLRCENVIITEWYDGLVQGIFLCHDQFFCAVLLAWDIDANNKLYLIFAIEHAHKDAILHAYDHPAEWPVVLDVLDQVIGSTDCYLSKEAPKNQESINVDSIPEQWKKSFHLAPFIIGYVTDKPAIAKYLC